jgi:hypothetical protein
MKRFVFTATAAWVAVSPSFEQNLSIPAVNASASPNDKQAFELPVALPMEEFTITVLSNHGDSYTCVPPFELYGFDRSAPRGEL